MSRLARGRRRRRVRRTLSGSAVVALLLGTVSLIGWARAGPPPDVGALRAPAANGRPVSSAAGGPSGSRVPAHDLVASHSARLADAQVLAGRAPAVLRIPALGVDAPVQAVGTVPTTRELEVPPDPRTVVWWADGSRPGDPTGTTVLAAHVDYGGVSGVFFHLERLPVGAAIDVVTANGSRRGYAVVARRHVPKPALAGQDVFTTAGRARLVLVTCGGAFDAATRSYRDNLVVVARPAPGG